MSKLLECCLALILLLSFQKPTSLNAEEIILSEFNANVLIPIAESEKVKYLNDRDPHVSYDAPYEILNVQYFKGTDELKGDDTFESGLTYKALLNIKLDSGYKLDSSTICKINGEECIITSESTIEYNFIPVESSASFKIKYEPGQIIEYTATEYMVDETNFDSSLDTYTGFKINGVKYDLDFEDYIYLSKDTTIEPLYETEKVYVSGVLIDESNRNDVLGDGSVRYDFDTNTLYLNNAHLKTAKTQIYNGEYIKNAIYATHELKIVLTGDNTFEDEDVDVLRNINIFTLKNLELTSNSEGSLKMLNDDPVDYIYALFSYGTIDLVNIDLEIYNSLQTLYSDRGLFSKDDIYIKDCDILIHTGNSLNDNGSYGTGQSFPIYTEKNIEMIDSNIDLKMKESNDQAAITFYDSFVAKGCSIRIINEGVDKMARSMGIYGLAFFAEINIENCFLDIDLTKPVKEIVQGISADFITLSQLQKGSKIKVSGVSDYANAISAYFKNTISGSDYTIIGETSAFRYVPLIELNECSELYIDQTLDGSSKKLHTDEPLKLQNFIQVAPAHHFEHLLMDENHHWYECDCGESSIQEVHFDYNLDGYCDECAYQMEVIEETKKEEKPSKPDYVVVNTGIK